MTFSTTAKPERLSRAGLTAGQYTLVIINFGSEPDQGTYEIGLTRRGTRGRRRGR